MKTASRSELFWNAPYSLESGRAVDPLGFDALRESMSNVLAPFLTGSTQHAEHYVAVTVGLRWAKSHARLPIDKEIWPLFAAFERGLKQYWHLYPSNRPARRRYLGKRRIAAICSEQRPDVQAPILQDQRGVGLLGNYIESLRAIGLVKKGQIVINDAAATLLLGHPRFEWAGTSPGSWDALHDIFRGVDLRSAWPRVGRRLFDLDDFSEERARMNSAARAVRSGAAANWAEIAQSRALLEPQRRMAQATVPTTELEDQLRALFTLLLEGGEPTVSRMHVRKLASLAGRINDLKVIDTVWPSEPTLAKALRRQIDNAARGRLSARTLLNWHLEIMHARGTDPWLHDLGDHSALKLPRERNDPDFRLTNMRTLLQETRWAG